MTADAVLAEILGGGVVALPVPAGDAILAARDTALGPLGPGVPVAVDV